MVPSSGKISISSYGAILDDARMEFWILRIISELAQTIFLIWCMELGVDKGLKFVESHFSKKSWISRSGAIRAEKCRDRSDHVENWSDHRIMLKIGRIDRIMLEIVRIDRIMLKIV